MCPLPPKYLQHLYPLHTSFQCTFLALHIINSPVCFLLYTLPIELCHAFSPAYPLFAAFCRIQKFLYRKQKDVLLPSPSLVHVLFSLSSVAGGEKSDDRETVDDLFIVSVKSKDTACKWHAVIVSSCLAEVFRPTL
uniref:Uncharacterized protein n=1 Tax=Ditylum brightwellii TaxID=49249 RepID=A0A6S8XWV3_9STRA|mmetsp:Transcript_7958/g.10653  ORF Transcript_7958/g.10653 Transcript_7958/m.10653 type:complete len:136 (-) Transcript_7958:255-662(-)